ncbi:MAG: hypothetical protein J5879_01875, partial [Clostridia bacterium]|nr:hypothetical protein [Clostridia bacterium]
MNRNNQKEYFPNVILDIAKKLYKDSYMCHRYLKLLSELNGYRRLYETEMMISKSFYETIYYALLESAFLKISKLFESDNNSYTICFLISHLKDVDDNNQYFYVKNRPFFEQVELQNKVAKYLQKNRNNDLET